MNPLQADPSRTGMLRKALMRDFARRFNLILKEMNQLIVDEDAFGIRAGERIATTEMYRTYNDSNILVVNERWRFLTSTQKVAAFGRWLKGKFSQYVLQEAVQEAEDRYWQAYVQEGYEKGAGRAYDAARKLGLASITEAGRQQHAGGKREFMRLAISAAETVEKTKLLASRVLTDLEGVGQSLATKLSRALTDGLVQGKNPRDIARTLANDLGVEKRRAETIARTEIIRAHAEGQLDALERLGVQQVGVAVEWSTAADGRVCPLCRPLDGVVFKTKEAHSLIPRHPDCRCAFLPAMVGERDDGQKKTKARIEAAIRASVAKEFGKKSKLSPAEQLARSKWLGADTKVDKKRPNTGIKAQK